MKSASFEEIEKNNFVLTPGRYVGLEEAKLDDEPVEDKIKRLTHELLEEFERGRELEDQIKLIFNASGETDG